MLYCLTGHIYFLTRFMAILLLLLFVYNMEIYKYTLTWSISFGAINLSTHCKNDHYFKMIILSRWLAIVPSIVHCGIDPTSVLRLSNLSAKSSLYSQTSCCERFTTSNCSLFCRLSPRFELKKNFFLLRLPVHYSVLTLVQWRCGGHYIYLKFRCDLLVFHEGIKSTYNN